MQSPDPDNVVWKGTPPPTSKVPPGPAQQDSNCSSASDVWGVEQRWAWGACLAPGGQWEAPFAWTAAVVHRRLVGIGDVFFLHGGV